MSRAAYERLLVERAAARAAHEAAMVQVEETQNGGGDSEGDRAVPVVSEDSNGSNGSCGRRRSWRVPMRSSKSEQPSS